MSSDIERAIKGQQTDMMNQHTNMKVNIKTHKKVKPKIGSEVRERGRWGKETKGRNIQKPKRQRVVLDHQDH